MGGAADVLVMAVSRNLKRKKVGNLFMREVLKDTLLFEAVKGIVISLSHVALTITCIDRAQISWFYSCIEQHFCCNASICLT